MRDYFESSMAEGYQDQFAIVLHHYNNLFKYFHIISVH